MSTILIACERETEQQVLTHALTGGGYQVLKSRDGIEALEIARAETPRLVLANVSLPKMDGFALFRKCKQDERLQRLPFIFYTSRRSDPKYERFAMELGAKGFIHGVTKPELLLSAVDEVLAAIEQQPDEQPTPIAPAPVQKPPMRTEAVELREASPAAREQLSERLAELEVLQARLAGASQFRALFDLSPAAMWVVDKSSHKMLAANDAALALYGYSRAEFLAMSADELLSGDATAFGATSLIAHRHKDGRALSLLTMSKDMEFEGREAEVIVAHDMTYRVRAERKIVDEAQRLRALFAALPDGYWVLDKGGRVLDVNERYCQMSGYSREELLGVKAADLQVDSDEETEASVSTPLRFRARHRRKDGTQWEVEISAGAASAGERSVQLLRPVLQEQSLIEARDTSRLSLLAQCLSADDETGSLQRIAAQIAQAFGSQAALIATVDRNTQTFHPLAVSAVNDASAAMSRVFQCPVEWTPAFEADAAWAFNDPQSAFPLPGLSNAGRYLLSCPKLRDQESYLFAVIGREAVYVDGERHDFEAMGQILAAMTSRKRSGAKVLAALQRADIAVEGMVDLLCGIVDQHDPHTSGGSNRVAALAVAMARLMGLGGEQQHILHLAARLHDVGNVMIPRELLARPVRLGEHEMALVKTHAELGARMLSGVNLGGGLADVVWQHHERLDGSGYPRGLKGAEILLEARILMVADTVEAMCSPRPHREALSLQAALAEIAAGSGRLYDAAVVETCTRLFKESGFEWPR